MGLSPEKLPQTLMQAMRHFDADTAERYIHSVKWPNGACCQKCGSIDVLPLQGRRKYHCRDCRAQTSWTKGTVLERSHLRADQWVLGVWMIVNCRNGVSSCEIARTIGCKQQSAWHLLHRVRHVMAEKNTGMVGGVVEADSTMVGGALRNMPRRRRKAITSRHPHANKTIVHAVRERRSGKVRAAVIANEAAASIGEMIAGCVEPESCLYTDSAHAYKTVAKALGHVHHSVNHQREEYVRGDVSTNATESFFNCLRRALKGTYVSASPDHLPAYVDEAVYRYNVRRDTEWDRFDAAMRAIVGKRLTYAALTDGAVR